MASTVWRGQLTFGLVSFPVKLYIAARKKRVTMHYLRRASAKPEPEPEEAEEDAPTSAPSADFSEERTEESTAPVERVRQEMVSAEEERSVPRQELVKGFEVSPQRYVTFTNEELRAMRPPNSPDMQILRSVRLDEIDPIYFETSYYVVPDRSAERPYALLLTALRQSGYVAIAKVTMHGREHVVAVRPGATSLLAHTMFYNDEIRAENEYQPTAEDVAPKELKLAESFVEAIAGPFAPEEFRDAYRDRLEQVIAGKVAQNAVASAGMTEAPAAVGRPVVDIAEALRKSLAMARKPVAAEVAKPSAVKPKVQRRKASG